MGRYQDPFSREHKHDHLRLASKLIHGLEETEAALNQSDLFRRVVKPLPALAAEHPAKARRACTEMFGGSLGLEYANCMAISPKIARKEYR